MNAAKVRGLPAAVRGGGWQQGRGWLLGRGWLQPCGVGVRGALCARHRLAGLSQAQGAAALRAAEQGGGAPGRGAGGGGGPGRLYRQGRAFFPWPPRRQARRSPPSPACPAQGSSNSYAIKKKDEIERVSKSNR